MTKQEEIDARAALLERLRQLNDIEEELTSLLVAKKYAEIEALGSGDGLSAAEIANAVRKCGRTLCDRPRGEGQRRNRLIRESAVGNRSSTTTCYLWTDEGNRAEIALTFTVIEPRVGKRSIVIDSITRQDGSSGIVDAVN